MGERIMEMREKDQADFDLETFVDLFDTAISSDNPTVQRALKNLILVSTIVNAQENPEGLRKGPLRRVIEDIQALNRRVGQLESAGAYRSSHPITPTPGTTGIPNVWPQPYYGPTPGTSTTPGQGQWPTTMPGTIPPGTIISGSSTTDAFKSQAINQIDVKVGSLLEKLESK